MKTFSQKEILQECLWVATKSKCLRARCGSIIINTDVFGQAQIIGRGYNSPPGDCPIAVCRKDSLPSAFKSDRTCCLHAEQRAIMDALLHYPGLVHGARLFFLRLSAEGQPETAGDPYCTICSKLALDVGLATFALWQGQGFVEYEANLYNEWSFGLKGGPASPNVKP
jgi:hypothetical protein